MTANERELAALDTEIANTREALRENPNDALLAYDLERLLSTRADVVECMKRTGQLA